MAEFARHISASELPEEAGELMGTVLVARVRSSEKKADPYAEAIVKYNGAFTALNEKGVSLLRHRERTADLIELVELLVNSVANTPKSFKTDIEEIDIHKAQFLDAREYARKDLEAARKSAAQAGTGFTAGAAVASMAPTAAMWVATTFGTASTGTAISTLSGAAASKAALAWLGGGALAAGGGGTAAGSALLAMAGPIGWSVAGATLLASITLFAKKKRANRAQKQEALTALKRNTALLKGMEAQVEDLLQRTASFRELLMKSFGEALELSGADFLMLSVPQRSQLVVLVNNTKACGELLSQQIDQDRD